MRTSLLLLLLWSVSCASVQGTDPTIKTQEKEQAYVYTEGVTEVYCVLCAKKIVHKPYYIILCSECAPHAFFMCEKCNYMYEHGTEPSEETENEMVSIEEAQE